MNNTTDGKNTLFVYGPPQSLTFDAIKSMKEASERMVNRIVSTGEYPEFVELESPESDPRKGD